MKKQPENCERCGAKLQIDGTPCYQKNCNYYKEEEEDDSFFLDDITDGIIYETDEDTREGLNDVVDVVVDNSAVSPSVSNDGDGIVSDAGDGCVWSVLKIFWSIITFPFRIIFWIFAFFIDD